MTTPLTPPVQNIETLISKASHDALNSVRALRQVPEWIKEDLEEHGLNIPDEVVGHLSLMITHARRLENMVADLATFARVGRSSGDHFTDFQECIDDIIHALNVPKGFSVTCDLGCDDVPFPKADMTALLGALISNGIKHHHKNTGCLHIETRTVDGACWICVRDDGPGIALADHNRIFDALTTLRPRDEVGGSGLGLAIAMRVINQYGGALALSSKAEGTGCVFEITLPRSVDDVG